MDKLGFYEKPITRNSLLATGFKIILLYLKEKNGIVLNNCWMSPLPKHAHLQLSIYFTPNCKALNIYLIC